MDTQSFSGSSPSHHEPYKLKPSFSGKSKHQTSSESQTALNNYKKGPQREAFFSQQDEISDDDEYANAEEKFSTDPEPEDDRIPPTNPGAEPPRDARDSGSARLHSTHLETSSSDRP